MNNFLDKLETLLEERKNQLPENSYTTKLFKAGKNRILQKIGEEATELVIAGKNEDKEEIKNECADLIFHILVFLHQENLCFDDIIGVLEKRHKN